MSPVSVCSLLLLLPLLACPTLGGQSEDSTPVAPAPACYSTAGVTGAVLATVLAIFALQAALYFLWNLYWKGKSGQHMVLVTDPEKGESIFAFDNPGFKEGPTILHNGEKENHNMKIKWTQLNSTSPKSKGKSLDDTFPSSPGLRRVPLKSHDFTGLGFNICGNMRDGIFVKDVLHRGPASESRLILPGDRIASIKINLSHMVFEDALTILSYASPYEVELEVESRLAGSGGGGGSSLSLSRSPSHRISHPLYRSQSSADIAKICKSSSRRMDERLAPSPSIKSDKSSTDLRYSSLDRKPQVIPVTLDHEKTQNSRNSIIENVQKHENIFHDVELSKVEVDEVDNSRKETPSPSNVKSILVKGIQNLKEKLHNSLHQDDTKEEPKSGSSVVNVTFPNAKIPIVPSNEGFERVDLVVPDVPVEVEKAGISARNRRSTIEDEIDLSEGEDPVAAKRNKRKAPKPPTEDEASLQHPSLESVDSDSENGDKRSGTTIELNSSHITVHQVAESESRKASSLGDLSRYEAENVILLERAVSLDLGDGVPGAKKRKAPVPPQDNVSFKEARLETGGTGGTLKKSSVWGTLEDVIQNGSDSSDADLGISGCSTPEKSEELISSTPFKFPSSSILHQENDVSNVEISNYHWDMSIPESDFITALNGDETPPELPTSPMPTMSTFITEIQVAPSSINPTEPNQVIHLENTQQLFQHINSHKLDLESLIDEESTISPDSPKSSPEPIIVDQLKKETPSISHEMIKVNHEDVMRREESTNEEERKPSLGEIELAEVEENGVQRELEEGESHITSDYTQLKHLDSQSPIEEKKLNSVSNPKREETHSEDRTERKSSHIQRSQEQVRKPSRSGVTVNVKTSPSRIPVRAGPRSPGSSGSSRTSSLHRNGHTSP